MRIKEILQIVVEALSGKKCGKCKYCVNGICRSEKYEECITSIYPKGFEPMDKDGD